ncbi:MAG TPA: amidohydrolase family protein [Candidatus Limnocylindrales bacterium]|nr:amidohydrolase family protein [Candidatus Limnocylindrales bacterium]
MPDAPALLLHGGTILTVDPARPRADAVGVAGERIVAVGPLEAVRAALPPDPETIDLGGRTLVPGFVDAHDHYFATAESFAGLDVRGVRSIAELTRRVAERAARTPPGRMIRGGGLDWSALPGSIRELGDIWVRQLGERVHETMPFRAWLELGIRPAISSDAFVQSYRPIDTISAACWRVTPSLALLSDLFTGRPHERSSGLDIARRDRVQFAPDPRAATLPSAAQPRGERLRMMVNHKPRTAPSFGAPGRSVPTSS